MSLKHSFLKCIICCVCTFSLSAVYTSAYSITEQDTYIDLIVKGHVSKGTCAFTFSHKVVNFSRALTVKDISNIGNTTPVEPFSVEYQCQDYNTEVLPDLQVTMMADNQSQIIDGKLSPKNNTTNAAFSFLQCDSVKKNCTAINFTNQESVINFPIQNGDNEKHFEAQVVKLGDAAIQPGKLSAAIVFTFLQP
ncbi:MULTISPECIES: fimbrial protein [Providencia]|uniref:fimbrial protein n=1 Tax=Providencia TaxID=586 RepID=UPI0014197E84|nr:MULTISPECIES: fimbrial protein [Providencia]EJD6081178.1 fimbrial protein [Providencia rettgeri]EJD6400811.1 fimbrial protein [Providencia rettgeri]EJD6581664.1 fimbrial protein [Providencia rettgeri]EJD6600577.1 fimbrial protein [Providencia rettgeri]EJD6614518.1 fimbrial protein [Providencia rettgeri]